MPVAEHENGFAQTMALVLYVIKEAHPNSKCTYYRFPKSGAKYSFDPDSEISIRAETERLSQRWRKHQWPTKQKERA